MNEVKSDSMTAKNTVPFWDMLFIAVLITLLGSIIIIDAHHNWQSKYTHTLNLYADSWCQDQIYKIPTDNYTFEIVSYSTGRWLESENKIECLGEPEEDLSGSVTGSRNYDDKSQYLGTDEPLKPTIIYKKSQKFDVPA